LSKFMWGQNYLGTLETLWNAFCYTIIPAKYPFLFIPTSLLGLAADLLFLANARKILSSAALSFLMILLLFLPPYMVMPQIQPAFSYTVLAILAFSAFFLKNAIMRGLLLGIAFYVQPISIYFIFPVAIYSLLQQNWKQFGQEIIGFALPLLLTLSRIGGPSLGAEIMQGSGVVSVSKALDVVSAVFLSLFGYPYSNFIPPPPILAFIAALSFIFFLIRRWPPFLKNWRRLPEGQGLFVFTMSVQFLLIPFLFTIRNYGRGATLFDNRYLWFWHYPVYLFSAYLLFEITTRIALKRILISCFAALLIFLGVERSVKAWQVADHDQILKEAVVYLRRNHISGVVGDYWAVYPLSFYSTVYKDWIWSVPLNSGKDRKPEWRDEIGKLSKIGYFCLTGEAWCKTRMPPQIKMAGSVFEPDPSEDKMIFQGPRHELVLKIYKRTL
jgi:hypothetical protein